MAENIFIGARYVVKYMGNWDDTAEYESLSAVLYGGNAYVSNRNVPASTLPTDTNYWAFWGSGNAVIDALSTRVAALEGRVDGTEVRITKNESDISSLASRLGLAEGRIDNLFAEQGAQAISIGQLQQETSDLRAAIAAIQADVALCERTANRNAGNGYMGLTGGLADRPTLLASPLLLTARLSVAQTLAAATELVKFDTILHSTTVGLTEGIYMNPSGPSKGNFYISGPSSVQYYDVWMTASVLCVPNGNTGIKDVYIHVNNEPRYATEAYVPTGANRISIQIPEVYLGPIPAQQQFGVMCTNWAIGDLIGLGSIVGDNYGSTWVSLKAYRRSLPV